MVPLELLIGLVGLSLDPPFSKCLEAVYENPTTRKMARQRPKEAAAPNARSVEPAPPLLLEFCIEDFIADAMEDPQNGMDEGSAMNSILLCGACFFPIPNSRNRRTRYRNSACESKSNNSVLRYNPFIRASQRRRCFFLL